MQRMADHSDVPYIVIERRSGAVTPFLWGALVGAAAALLWAPRSGRDTQRELHGAADRLGFALRERVGEARDTVAEVVDGVRQRVQDQVDSVRDAVETRTEGVRQAVEAGRTAARDAREDLEQRVADAKRAAGEGVVRDDTPGAGVADVSVVVTEVVEERPFRPNSP
jgi:gas vesicle protein